MFCHAEGESAVCEWFSVCIYTTQLQNVLELRQGITKQMEKALFPQCVREGQRGQSEVQELFPRCSEQSPSGLIPVLALLTDCCGAGFTGLE